jgi:hypothetical protein
VYTEQIRLNAIQKAKNVAAITKIMTASGLYGYQRSPGNLGMDIGIILQPETDGITDAVDALEEICPNPPQAIIDAIDGVTEEIPAVIVDITSQSDQDLAVHDGQVATPDVKTPEPADDVMPPQEDEVEMPEQSDEVDDVMPPQPDEVDDGTEVDPTR